MKAEKYLLLMLLLTMCTTHQLFAQPYYYHDDAKVDGKFWRFNLQTNVDEFFCFDTVYYSEVDYWDPTQTWLIAGGDAGGRNYPIFVSDVILTSNPQVRHWFPEQDTSQATDGVQSFTKFRWPLRNGASELDGIVYNPVKNEFYVTWTTDFLRSDYSRSWDSVFIFQKTATYNASTFAFVDTLPIPPAWITSLSSVSDDGNYLYLEHWGYQQVKAIGKYSLITKELVINRNLSDIYVPGGYTVSDSKKGNYLIVFLYPRQQMEDTKYGVYNIDKDSVYGLIPFPLSSNGSISSDGKYVIIEETPVNNIQRQDSMYFHPGRLSIFDGISGTLLQRLKLPQDGKVLVFDKYPSMLYYYFQKKQSSINIDLTKLVAISTINSQNVLVGSGAFTLSVTGKNFTATSNVQLNGTNRAAAFISDTLLQATIRAGDVDTATTAYIAVKDSIGPSSHATTDSLALNVISVPQQSLQPILDCVTQIDDTTYTAWFGYENDDTTSIFVPVGPMNKFTPDPNDRTQPTVFEQGKNDKVFSVTFHGKNVTWKLNGNEVVASKKSPGCN